MILNVICNDPHILSQGRHNLEDFTEKTTIWIFRLLTCLTKKLRPKPRATKTTILRKYHRDLSRRPTQLSRLALSASHRTVGAIVSIEGSQVDRSLVQWILSSLSSSSGSFIRYTTGMPLPVEWTQVCCPSPVCVYLFVCRVTAWATGLLSLEDPHLDLSFFDQKAPCLKLFRVRQKILRILPNYLYLAPVHEFYIVLTTGDHFPLPLTSHTTIRLHTSNEFDTKFERKQILKQWPWHQRSAVAAEML